MKILYTLIISICFNVILYSQDFFPIKLGNRYQYKETYTYVSPYFDKYVITKDTIYEGKTFYRFDNDFFNYDSLENKLYILTDKGIELAVDFNTPADSSMISNIYSNYVSKGTYYKNIFGRDRLCFEMEYFYSNNTPPWISQESIEYIFADSIGLFQKHSYNYSIESGGRDYNKELYAAKIDSVQYSTFSFDINLISYVEDTPINYFPLKIRAGTSVSDFNFVDSMYADVYVYRKDTLICNYRYPFIGIILTANINMDSSILKVGDLVKLRCILKENTVLENSYFSPKSGYYTFRILEPAMTEVENTKQNPEFLFSAYPSPFNSSIKIAFQLLHQSAVNIEIYNILGKRVKSILNSELLPGTYSYIWNAKNESGDILPSGIYLIRLNSDNMSIIKKVVLLK